MRISKSKRRFIIFGNVKLVGTSVVPDTIWCTILCQTGVATLFVDLSWPQAAKSRIWQILAFTMIAETYSSVQGEGVTLGKVSCNVVTRL